MTIRIKRQEPDPPPEPQPIIEVSLGSNNRDFEISTKKLHARLSGHSLIEFYTEDEYGMQKKIGTFNRYTARQWAEALVTFINQEDNR